jgi:ubiquitin C-terminal hydrolase
MVEKYNVKYAAVPRGLHNIGNTCYFNSLVQALMSCPSLVHNISTSSNPLAGALCRIYAGQSQDVRELLNIIIKNHAGKFNTLHYGWQEDANEGLMMLVEDIKGLENVFNVRYKTSLECKCGYSYSVDTHNKEPPEIFIDMYMPSPTEKNPHDHFIKYLRICVDVPDDYKCDKCRRVGTTIKTRALCRISSVLIVTFKKYTNKNLIDYPLNFTITTKEGPITYKVVAQIEHYGGMSGGHYTAQGLRSDGVSYAFNDSSVNKQKFSPTPNTYMVFYHAF